MNNAVETISRVLFLVILGNGILNLFAHFAVLLLRDSQYRNIKSNETRPKTLLLDSIFASHKNSCKQLMVVSLLNIGINYEKVGACELSMTKATTSIHRR